MTTRRGLSFIEVMTATVLMAILVAACVPILRHAARALEERGSPLPVRQLAALADAFLVEPAAFGLDTALGEEPFELHWPDAIPPRPAVLVHCLERDDPPEGHRWLVFSCDGVSVVRWLPPPEPGETG